MTIFAAVPPETVAGGSDKPLTIGRLAQAARVHVETVRYYQRRGLIEEPHAACGSTSASSAARC